MVFSTTMSRLSTKFCKTRSSSFCVILLTNKQISADENITFLTEVIILEVRRAVFHDLLARLVNISVFNTSVGDAD